MLYLVNSCIWASDLGSSIETCSPLLLMSHHCGHELVIVFGCVEVSILPLIIHLLHFFIQQHDSIALTAWCLLTIAPQLQQDLFEREQIENEQSPGVQCGVRQRNIPWHMLFFSVHSPQFHYLRLSKQLCLDSALWELSPGRTEHDHDPPAIMITLKIEKWFPGNDRERPTHPFPEPFGLLHAELRKIEEFCTQERAVGCLQKAAP